MLAPERLLLDMVRKMMAAENLEVARLIFEEIRVDGQFGIRQYFLIR